MDAIQIQVLSDDDAAAAEAAKAIARAAREAVAERGKFVAAVSGGSTPWKMLRRLAEMSLPWEEIWIAQVDERIAPEGHADRNLTHLRECLAASPARPEQIAAMPVEAEDLEGAALRYASRLCELCGSPPVLDLVHLGLGTDGHTASLIPGDPVLDVNDAEVAVTGAYQGRQRMTMTYPLINRARQILWLVTGASKREMLRRLCSGDAAIPAGRVRQEAALVLTDKACWSEART
jgi:6-phosphogluconolactonase